MFGVIEGGVLGRKKENKFQEYCIVHTFDLIKWAVEAGREKLKLNELQKYVDIKRIANFNSNEYIKFF